MVTLQKAGLCHMIQLITQTKTWSQSEFHSYQGMVSPYHMPGDRRVVPSWLLQSREQINIQAKVWDFFKQTGDFLGYLKYIN